MKESEIKQLLATPEMIEAFLCDRKRSSIILAKNKRNYHPKKLIPRYSVGDIIWVREAFSWEGQTKYNDPNPIGKYYYKADPNPDEIKHAWKPSMYMPIRACRIFLEVTDIRMKRLNDITEEDAINEGILPINDLYLNYDPDQITGETMALPPIESFKSLWESTKGVNAYGNNYFGIYSWDKNPLVWVYSYVRTDKPDWSTHTIFK